MSSEHCSPRVNSKRLPDYIGRTVRLFPGENAIVEAPDGGQVVIRMPHGDTNIADTTYVEIIGNVVDASTVKMMACINLGSEVDLKLVNDVVEHIHNPKFYDRMFS